MMEAIMNEPDIFDQMESAWGLPAVPRTKVGEASSFTISPKTMANLDSLGLGPPDKFTINGKICYTSKSFFAWLRSRSRRIH